MNTTLESIRVIEPRLLEMIQADPTIESAIKQLGSDAQSGVNAHGQRVLEAIAENHLIHYVELRQEDAFQKGMLHGLLIALSLPRSCAEFVKQLAEMPPQEGTQP